MQLQLHHEELTSIQRPTVLAKIVTLKRGRTHMRLCQAPHSDHRTGCGAKERNRQGKTWMASLSFLSFFLCLCLPSARCLRFLLQQPWFGEWCHTGNHPAMPDCSACYAMLCYAMLCYAFYCTQCRVRSALPLTLLRTE